MQRKLLGIAIVALLPLTAAQAAPGCPQVRESVQRGVDLRTAMDQAVSSGQCTPSEAAGAGSSLASSSAERQIVAAFRSVHNLDGGGNVGGGRLAGGQLIIPSSFGSGSGGGGGGGLASGD